MKSFWIIDTLKNIETKEQVSAVVPMQGVNKIEYLNGCIFKPIHGKMFLLAPLSEVARIYQINVSDFADDLFLDVLNELKKKHGYFPILTLTDDE